MKMIKENSAFFALLSGVWLYLLGLIMLIGMLLVPIEKTKYPTLIYFIIDMGKILLSMIFVGIWLLSWYKLLSYILHYEMNAGINPKDN